MKSKLSIYLDRRKYSILLYRNVQLPPLVPRIIIVTFQPNDVAKKIAQMCVTGIRKYTSEEFELWIIDNNSPSENLGWLRQISWANIVLNRTEPYPPKLKSIVTKFKSKIKNKHHQQYWGSYANAIGLEIVAKLLDENVKYLITLHMDTSPCNNNWLSYLLNKVIEGHAAAGMRMDNFRVADGSVHISGLLLDYQIFQKLHLNFFPNLPAIDVGDSISINLKKAGFSIFSAKNTYTQPQLVEQIPISSPFRNFMVDRSFDDEGNIIFIHLGRGLNKSTIDESKLSALDWIYFVENNLLK
jgi:hypothetical protein